MYKPMESGLFLGISMLLIGQLPINLMFLSYAVRTRLPPVVLSTVIAANIGAFTKETSMGANSQNRSNI